MLSTCSKFTCFGVYVIIAFCRCRVTSLSFRTLLMRNVFGYSKKNKKTIFGQILANSVLSFFNILERQLIFIHIIAHRASINLELKELLNQTDARMIQPFTLCTHAHTHTFNSMRSSITIIMMMMTIFFLPLAPCLLFLLIWIEYCHFRRVFHHQHLRLCRRPRHRYLTFRQFHKL